MAVATSALNPFFFFQEKGIDTVNSSVIISNTITLIHKYNLYY